MFIGYVADKKAYKAYDLINHKIYITRDIRFYEDTFPFASGTSFLRDKSSSLPLVSLDTPFDYDFTNPNSSSSNISSSHTPKSSSSSNPANTSTSDCSIQPSIPRVSNRTKHPHKWLNDYFCHAIANSLFVPTYSNNYVAFIANV